MSLLKCENCRHNCGDKICHAGLFRVKNGDPQGVFWNTPEGCDRFSLATLAPPRCFELAGHPIEWWLAIKDFLDIHYIPDAKALAQWWAYLSSFQKNPRRIWIFPDTSTDLDKPFAPILPEIWQEYFVKKILSSSPIYYNIDEVFYRDETEEADSAKNFGEWNW